MSDEFDHGYLSFFLNDLELNLAHTTLNCPRDPSPGCLHFQLNMLKGLLWVCRTCFLPTVKEPNLIKAVI